MVIVRRVGHDQMPEHVTAHTEFQPHKPEMRAADTPLRCRETRIRYALPARMRAA